MTAETNHVCSRISLIHIAYRLLLTCCLLLSLCVPAFAETVQGERPMIYLEGQGIYLYTDDGTLVYDVGVSLTDSLSRTP